MSSGMSAKSKRGEILPAIETILEIAKASVAGLGVIGLEVAIGGLLSVVTTLKACLLRLTVQLRANLIL